jgi:hypothetical protein
MLKLLYKLIVIGCCAELWHIGGSGHKWVRSYIVPIILGASKALLCMNFLALLYIPVLIGLLALIEYGKDSKVHRLIVKYIFKGKGSDGENLLVEITVRATCGFIWSLAGLVFAVITGHYAMLIAYSVGLTLANVIFGRLIKDVRISERGVGASVALAVLI